MPGQDTKRVSDGPPSCKSSGRSGRRRPLHVPNLDGPHRHRLADIAFRPVFITGDHRSGTTFLYLLLQRVERFNVVTAYHVLRYRQLLHNHFTGTTAEARRDLAREFHAAGLLDRVIDGVPVSPDMPEEYGFILADPGKPLVGPASLDRFTEACRKVTLLGEPGRPILLKNPWDFGNSLYLKQQFPSARFLYLHREPIRTVNSQLRAFRSMVASRNEYVAMLAPRYGRLFQRPLILALVRAFFSPRHGLAPRMIAYRCARSIREAARQRRQLSAADLLNVRYEDLCRQPNETVADILRWLGIAQAGMPDLHAMVAPRGGQLLPEVERRRPGLVARLKDYCDEFGYPG